MIKAGAHLTPRSTQTGHTADDLHGYQRSHGAAGAGLSSTLWSSLSSARGVRWTGPVPGVLSALVWQPSIPRSPIWLWGRVRVVQAGLCEVGPRQAGGLD